SKLLGAEVQFEFINANDLQSRITASVQSQSGPDIIHMLHNWPHLYENGLLDVSDLADWQGKDQGGFYPQSEAYAKVGGRFLALPHSIVPGLIAYRKDACDEGGLAWDDTNNNRAFLGGEICATLNGASIYIAAKRGQEKIKDERGEPLVRDIQHARLPAGPAGSWSYHTAFAHGV